MANSIFQSLKNKLGQNGEPGSEVDDWEVRISEVADIFPENTSIVPADHIDPEWVFEVNLESGEKYLAWTASREFSGVNDADREAPFPDSSKARELEHTNILTPLHITRGENFSVVVTPYFGGTLLLKKIDEGDFDRKATMTIFFQVASSFHTAHREGILHRAVSPANILVDDELNVRVFGFGLSNVFFDRWMKVLRAHKRRRADYIAPEVWAEGMTTALPHCDGFSVARIVYEMLTGQIAKSNFAVLPSKLCDVPPHLDDALLNAMHTDPSKRPQSLAALQKQYAGLNARSSRQKEETYASTFELGDFFSRHFKWMQSDAFKVAIVVLFFGLVFLGVLAYEKIRISPILVSLDSSSPAGQLVSQWETLSESDIQRFYEDDGEQFNDLVVSTHQVLVDSRKYDEAEHFVKKVSRTQSPPPQNAPQVKLQPYRGGVGSQRPVRTTIVYDPVENSASISSALDQLKRRNPSQTKWHYELLVTSDRTILDLSGHANLRDISALKGHIIHELDLSDTGVEKIFDLIGMPLDELRLCRSRVQDIDPVVGLPLNVLTFVDVPVTDISAVRRIPSLTSLIGQDKNGPLNEIKPPRLGQATWINERGLKFRSLNGLPVMLAVNEFPSQDGMEPMTSITFKKAQNLCSHMTVRERKTGRISVNHRYRLPTDGEWSYAALLPESRFLSPKGRMLQKIDPVDFVNHRKTVVALEKSGENVEEGQFHNGFRNMNNIIGEWVDRSHGHFEGTNIVRGLFAGSELENLRSRTSQNSETSSPVIGFRPVLEFETYSDGPRNFDMTDPEDLRGKNLDTWDAPFLKAAASSSFVLQSLLTSNSYRDTYIANQSQKRDPFTNRFYLRVDVPMTWTRARAVAAQLGGRLATATSAEHLAWIHSTYCETSPLGTPVWMGASASPEKLDWKWVDHEEVPRILRPAPVDTDKRRGALLTPKVDSYGLMTATPVGEQHSFLVEWDPVD